MKRSVALFSILIVFVFITYSFSNMSFGKNDFSFDISKIKLGGRTEANSIESKFDSKYSIKGVEDLKIEESLEKDMISLSKEVTYIMLGRENTDSSDINDLAKRADRIKEIIHSPYPNGEVPKDEEGLADLTDERFSELFATESVVYGMFEMLSEREISYKNIEEIYVYELEDGKIMTQVFLSGVTAEEPNQEEPMKIDVVDTNLQLIYLFKKNPEQEYKLYYLQGETQEDISEYLTKKENAENEGTSLALDSKFTSEFRDIYNYSKLDNLSDDKINEIYESNKNSVVVLNTYYSNGIDESGTGFFISPGIIATTWGYVENSLNRGQFITARDCNGNSYEIDGFVNIFPELDIAIIKLKEQAGKGFTYGDNELIKEDPAIMISSNGGVNLSVSSRNSYFE